MKSVSSNIGYIVQRINDIWEEKPGKKALQKLVFLIEQKGVNLGYHYGLHFYGPYSADLDATTMLLNSDGILEFDYTGSSHLMSIDEQHFTVKPDALSPEQLQQIDELIGRFNGHSASGLELLTTAIYAYDHLADKSKESVVRGVQKIKGAKYTEKMILHSLNDFEYFNKPLSD